MKTSAMLCAALALAWAGGSAATAAPLAVPTASRPPIVLAANGCGPGYFRTLAGECFPNRTFVGPRGRVQAPPPCPPGFLRAPDRPLCYPVY